MGYSRLEPGRELEVREYISFQRGRDGFCELIECSVDELLERKAESMLLIPFAPITGDWPSLSGCPCRGILCERSRHRSITVSAKRN